MEERKMKNRIGVVCLILLIPLSVCYTQVMDISIEYNLKTSSFLPVCFWINNNTGMDIPNVEYILNDNYFYRSNLSSCGESLSLFDFAKQDGTRYDYFSIKPIELKVKSKLGTYSVKFDDIPYEEDTFVQYSQLLEAFMKAFVGYDDKHIPTFLPNSEEFRDKIDPLQYSQIIEELRVKTKDSVPSSLIVKVAFGYSSNDKSTAQNISSRKVEITDFLRAYFQSKTVSELKQEEKIKIEIRNEMNDNFLTRNKIKDVRFTKYDIIEP